MTPASAIIVQAARAPSRRAGETDAQWSFPARCQHCDGARVPAVTIGGGGEGGDAHTGEWYRRESHLGPQSALLLVLALAGLEGVTKPMLGLRTETEAAGG